MQSSKTLISNYEAPKDKPLTINESVGGIIINDGVTLAPGGKMTSMVLGKDASDQQISDAIDLLRLRKKTRKKENEKKSHSSEQAQQQSLTPRTIHMNQVSAQNISMDVMSSKASKEDQIAMAIKARKHFENPAYVAPEPAESPKQAAGGSASDSPIEAPMISNSSTKVGSKLTICVSEEASEAHQVAIAKAISDLLISQNKKPVRALFSPRIVAKQDENKNSSSLPPRKLAKPALIPQTSEEDSLLQESNGHYFTASVNKQGERIYTAHKKNSPVSPSREMSELSMSLNAEQKHAVSAHSSAHILSSLSADHEKSKFECNSIADVIIGNQRFTRIDGDEFTQLSQPGEKIPVAQEITPDKQQQLITGVSNYSVLSLSEKREKFSQAYDKRQARLLKKQDQIEDNQSRFNKM